MSASGHRGNSIYQPAHLRKRACVVAMAFMVGMRETLSNFEVIDLPDFVEAMVVAGLLFEKRYEKDPIVASSDFARRAFSRITTIERDAVAMDWDEEAELVITGPVRQGARVTGRTGPLAKECFLEAAIAADSVALELAKEHDLTLMEAKNIFAQAIAFCGYVLAVTDDDKEETYESLQCLVTTHIKAWALTV